VISLPVRFVLISNVSELIAAFELIACVILLNDNLAIIIIINL